jgi:prepilin-type processing-associated H-X9-DG protein
MKSHSESRDGRPAATLLELLVVIAILGVAMAILLPAVQRVRDAAARADCQNRLRQIGIASQNYHAAHHSFPTGVSYEGGKSPHPHMTWCVRLLPFLEQEALHRRALEAFAKDSFFRNDPPHEGVRTVVPAFVCPADGRTRQAADLGGGIRVALLSYLGAEGIDQVSKGGVLFLDSRVRLADITDGSSETLLVGERPPSADLTLGWWYGGWGQAKDGSADSVLGVRERIVSSRWDDCDSPTFRPGRLGDGCSAFHYWSVHIGGGHFLFADGSVRYMSYGADPLMPALATRAGGEVVPTVP